MKTSHNKKIFQTETEIEGSLLRDIALAIEKRV